jgi:hypothetical protein
VLIPQQLGFVPLEEVVSGIMTLKPILYFGRVCSFSSS